jgi:hypothetical protein
MGCVKQKATDEHRTIACVDEAGCGVLPMAVSPYAPVGQTPVLKVTRTPDHLSAIGAITPQGRIFLQTPGHACKGPDVVRFLPVLLREIPGTRRVLWDGAPLPRCQVSNDCLTPGGATRIHLERVPASAPERTPHEGVWKLLKRVERTKVCGLDLQHVETPVRRAKERVRHRVFVLRQCFAHAGCFLENCTLRSIEGVSHLFSNRWGARCNHLRGNRSGHPGLFSRALGPMLVAWAALSLSHQCARLSHGLRNELYLSRDVAGERSSPLSHGQNAEVCTIP